MAPLRSSGLRSLTASRAFGLSFSALGTLAAGAACNAITGVGDLSFDGKGGVSGATAVGGTGGMASAGAAGSTAGGAGVVGTGGMGGSTVSNMWCSSLKNKPLLCYDFDGDDIKPKGVTEAYSTPPAGGSVATIVDDTGARSPPNLLRAQTVTLDRAQVPAPREVYSTTLPGPIESEHFIHIALGFSLAVSCTGTQRYGLGPTLVTLALSTQKLGGNSIQNVIELDRSVSGKSYLALHVLEVTGQNVLQQSSVPVELEKNADVCQTPFADYAVDIDFDYPENAVPVMTTTLKALDGDALVDSAKISFSSLSLAIPVGASTLALGTVEVMPTDVVKMKLDNVTLDPKLEPVGETAAH